MKCAEERMTGRQGGSKETWEQRGWTENETT